MGKVACPETWAKHYVTLDRFTDDDHVKQDFEAVRAVASRDTLSASTKDTLSVSTTDTLQITYTDSLPGGHGSLVMGVAVNLVKSIIGSGILCLPAALLDGGLGHGVAGLIVNGLLSVAGFLAIGYACHRTGASNYREAWSRTVGISSGAIDLIIFLECILSCVGYVIIILDYVSTSLHGIVGFAVGGQGRAMIAAIIAAVVLLPLCLQRDLRNLRVSSLVGNFTMMYTILYVVLESVSHEDIGAFLESSTFFGARPSGCFRAASVMVSSYGAHWIAPEVFAELRDNHHPNPFRAFCLVVLPSFGMSVVIYIVFAVAGFARFGDSIQGNVLVSYDSSICLLVAWITMAATLTMSFPLVFKAARDTFVQMCAIPSEPTCKRQRVSKPSSWALTTVALLAVTMVIGSMFTEISRVLAFRGALLGCPISFVLPGLMLLNCPLQVKHAVGCRIVAKTLIIFGVAACVLGVYFALQD